MLSDPVAVDVVPVAKLATGDNSSSGMRELLSSCVNLIAMWLEAYAVDVNA